MVTRALAALLLVVACTGRDARIPANPTTRPTPTSATTPVTGSSTTTIPAPPTTPTITSTSSTTSTFESPAFHGSIQDTDEESLAHSWTPDCPVRPEDTVLVEVTHWGFDGSTHEGSIVVARDQGKSVLEIFRGLFAAGYPIESVVPIGDLPVGIEDDDPDYNNTSGLHCRRATGSSRWSEHARGLAIDINPFLNPFITPSILWPVNSSAYLDRSLDEPGMIHAGDAVVQTFHDHGWLWGGYWESIKDYQHFSVSGR